MGTRYNAPRAALNAVLHVLEKSAPHDAELARLRLILEADELWSAPQAPPVPSTGSTSGEHSFSIRVRPPRNLGDWRVVLVSAVVSVAAQLVPQLAPLLTGETEPPATLPAPAPARVPAAPAPVFEESEQEP